MSTYGMGAGTYKATATIHYDGEVKDQERQFNIGSLFVRINNHTSELYVGKINQFDTDIENRWNNVIGDSYVELKMNGITAKTPSTSLRPWQKTRLSAYYDTSKTPLGEYPANITVFYDGKSNQKSTTVFVIDFIETKVPEKQEPFRINIAITPTTILIALIVLLVSVDIIWLVMRKRDRKDAKAKPKKSKTSKSKKKR